MFFLRAEFNNLGRWESVLQKESQQSQPQVTKLPEQTTQSPPSASALQTGFWFFWFRFSSQLAKGNPLSQEKMPSSYSFFFKKTIKILLLSFTVGVSEIETQRDFPSDHFPDGCTSQHWFKLKSGARSFIGSSTRGWRAVRRLTWVTCCIFPRSWSWKLDGKWRSQDINWRP